MDFDFILFILNKIKNKELIYLVNYDRDNDILIVGLFNGRQTLVKKIEDVSVSSLDYLVSCILEINNFH